MHIYLYVSLILAMTHFEMSLANSSAPLHMRVWGQGWVERRFIYIYIYISLVIFITINNNNVYESDFGFGLQMGLYTYACG